ncbi:uncharacterized protein DC041_0002699 [Schistosoma bovis]|uniref:Uncharacterized protein n=1 Tax=Schistosoma bovis TaxID=6184 RepID=A0A430QUK5_SCHBO|nr:uncharacterized protein DC041_0002699 [Schistosoma bovis]
MEIAYGTLSGRVCLIVQHPETVGYSPQLFQTFNVHRSMVTRVVLSEKYLISGTSFIIMSKLHFVMLIIINIIKRARTNILAEQYEFFLFHRFSSAAYNL